MVSSNGDIAQLSHLRVLDLADEKASFCSKILAWLGTEVIKIEKPGGDPSRAIGPFLNNNSDPENSLSFWFNNTGKRSITLNLNRKEGRKIFRKLVTNSDILIETFPPEYLKKYELDYGHVSKLNEGLIMASITGFGQTGPYSSYQSCDIVASASGGQMYVTGGADAPPLKPFDEQSYYVASLFAAVGILIALQQRNKNQKGQHIDISLQETNAASLGHIMIRLFNEQVVSKRQGPVHWSNASGIFPCKDGYIFLSFDREWDTLVEWMASEKMESDLKAKNYNDRENRRRNYSHISDVISQWTKKHSKDELFRTAQLMRFPWAPVQNITELPDNPQLIERHFFNTVEHDNIDKSFGYPGLPLNLSRNRKIKRAPLIGEHNFEVYHDELGLSPKQLDRLARLNII